MATRPETSQEPKVFKDIRIRCGSNSIHMDSVAKARLPKGTAKYGCDHQQTVRHLLADRLRAR